MSPSVFVALEREEPHQSVPAFAIQRSWRQSISATKLAPKMEFCYNMAKNNIRVRLHNTSVPELLVDAAVDDKVDGGVEDEEDVVGGVQVVDVGRRVESPYGKRCIQFKSTSCHRHTFGAPRRIIVKTRKHGQGCRKIKQYSMLV